jgi:hypothetical protein
VPTGKYAGVHVGRLAVRRATGCFRVGKAEGINTKHRKLLHRADACAYGRRPAPPPATEVAGFRRGVFL